MAFTAVHAAAVRSAGAFYLSAPNETHYLHVASLAAAERPRTSDDHLERGPATLTADVAFQHSANAAAAAWNQRPAYVAYHVATHVSIPSMHRERDIVRSVVARTSDDLAVVQDLPQGAVQVTHAFPMLPTLDALGDFTFTWRVRWPSQLEAYVHDMKPMTYDAKPSSTADIVVARLLAYRVSYAPDSSDAPDGKTHLKMHPYHFTTAQASRDNFFFDDVIVDNRTDLPTHVSFIGPDGLAFSVDYATIDGHWVVNHAHYEQTAFAPLRIGRIHAIADAAFDQFTFPATSPDPRLG